MNTPGEDIPDPRVEIRNQIELFITSGAGRPNDFGQINAKDPETARIVADFIQQEVSTARMPRIISMLAFLFDLPMVDGFYAFTLGPLANDPIFKSLRKSLGERLLRENLPDDGRTELLYTCVIGRLPDDVAIAPFAERMKYLREHLPSVVASL